MSVRAVTHPRRLDAPLYLPATTVTAIPHQSDRIRPVDLAADHNRGPVNHGALKCSLAAQIFAAHSL